jgi:hypothetical protein
VSEWQVLDAIPHHVGLGRDREQLEIAYANPAKSRLSRIH